MNVPAGISFIFIPNVFTKDSAFEGRSEVVTAGADPWPRREFLLAGDGPAPPVESVFGLRASDAPRATRNPIHTRHQSGAPAPRCADRHQRGGSMKLPPRATR